MSIDLDQFFIGNNMSLKNGKSQTAGILHPVVRCSILQPTLEVLERLYSTYNRSEFIHPDPLEFLSSYSDPLDREVVGIIASSLAYGRVKQILRSVAHVLDCLEGSPAAFIMESSPQIYLRKFFGFKHRFTTGEDIAALLTGLKEILREYGSIQACFLEGMRDSHSTVLPALREFVRVLKKDMNGNSLSFLIPSPERGSACKRLNLFLRWMVRDDEVDPGGWTGVQASKLIVPLDTHMHRIGLALGLTKRRQADMRTALEVTDGFRAIFPSDPVRYDFALTRLGIQDGMSWLVELSN
jgi:uncharacterized protein (TIGR02757 family)